VAGGGAGRCGDTLDEEAQAGCGEAEEVSGSASAHAMMMAASSGVAVRWLVASWAARRVAAGIFSKGLGFCATSKILQSFALQQKCLPYSKYIYIA
jgi:hypothetical protein